MPLLLEFEFESGRKQKIQIPAEVWRNFEYRAIKVFYFDEKVRLVRLDPDLQTADIETSNNIFPRQAQSSQFERFKKKQKK